MSDPNLQAVPILVRSMPDYGYAADEAEEKPEGFTKHSKFPFPWGPKVELDEESLRLTDLQASFDRIRNQVESLMQAQSDSGHGLGIAEVTAKLGISAKGGLAFVAEAGIEASIEVKFVSRR
ncbi:CU044_2847 family protein [Streptomyces goshikiensis]|uniref:CU044_2847 family protein n=1 Tax=Streptomyces goshikiensis TaxID=1942 RepID=UPI00372387E3